MPVVIVRKMGRAYGHGSDNGEGVIQSLVVMWIEALRIFPHQEVRR